MWADHEADSLVKCVHLLWLQITYNGADIVQYLFNEGHNLPNLHLSHEKIYVIQSTVILKSTVFEKDRRYIRSMEKFWKNILIHIFTFIILHNHTSINVTHSPSLSLCSWWSSLIHPTMFIYAKYVIYAK